jgi:hypothetical protein
VLINSARAAPSDNWRRLSVAEWATFVPTQKAPFSNYQSKFIAKYAGLMRRIPQADDKKELCRVRRVIT